MAPKQGSRQKKSSRNTSSRNRAEIEIGGISGISGEVNIAAGDIIKTIQTYYERDLTPGEIIEKDLKLETDELARGLREYLERLQRQVSATDPADPYKGLNPYALSDADVFFGREQALSDLRKAMKRGKLTILQAESGAGKTSLLQAGIIPRLIAEKNFAVLVRPQFANPTYAIKQNFIGNLELTPKLVQAPLVDFLRRVNEMVGSSRTLYLFLDQFEEFFAKATLEEDRQAFIRDLAQCLDDATLDVRWVISITADALSQLGKFAPRIKNPFANVQSLYLFDREEAADVIAKPAQHYKITFQDGLLERLLDDLSQHQDSLIAPTQIQLVCVALYDDCREAEPVFTVAQYEQIGGAEGILRDYIAKVMHRLPLEERAPAYRILEELVTSEKKRILRSKGDLEISLANKGISADLTNATLDHLVNQRLLRKLDDDTEYIRYEIVHDYLLNEIELNQALRELKEAEELLTQGKRNWKKFGVVLNRDTLAIIRKKRGELHLMSEDICLLLLSLTDTKMKSRELRAYLSMAQKKHLEREITDLLLPWTAHDTNRIRTNAYKVLWNFVRYCPAPTRSRILLWNIIFQAPIFLMQGVVIFLLAYVLYQTVWIFSRDRLEKIGWQPVQALEVGCLSSGTAEEPLFTVNPSNPANLIAFGKSPPFICQSTDAGYSWKSIGTGLPSQIQVNSIAMYDRNLILLTPEQAFYREAKDGTWSTFSLPGQTDSELRTLSIGGRDGSIFIGRLPHEIISLQTNRKCWGTIEREKAVLEDEKGKCWNPIDTRSLSGEINFLSTNEKYVVANTSDGTWYTEIGNINWKRQPGLDEPVLSFALRPQSFFDDGIFIVVLPGRGVQRGQLGIPEFRTTNLWPFPSTNQDAIWDWPPDTKAIAATKYVFFAQTGDSLQRYPGWSIFDREWWRIMKEVQSSRR
jgi:hypothetical protein